MSGGPVSEPADAAVEAMAERFARELAAVAGTPHRGADPVAVALDVAGETPCLVAVDDDPDLEALARALAEDGHDVLRPGDPRWTERLPDAALGVTRCAAALADTGTVLLTFGPGRPRSTSLVPRAHLAVVAPDDLVPSLADGLARVPMPPPSGMACVTGPSRSGDIEQILTLGVHGPARVDVVLP